MKQKIPNDPTKTMGLYSVCCVHVEAKYDLTTNVSVLDGMTNGAECTIKKLTTEHLIRLDQVLYGFCFRILTLVDSTEKNIHIYIMYKYRAL